MGVMDLKLRCLSEYHRKVTAREHLLSREELLSGYGIHKASVHRFTTLKNFKKICMEGYDYDLGRVLTRYVAFDNVDNKNVLAIVQHRKNRRDLPNTRVLYNEELHLLIIKVTVGMHQESAGGLIATVVTTKLIIARIDPFSLALCGGARCGTVGRRHKEANRSFCPRSRTSVFDWPTLAIEVGVSESLGQLQSDAFFWLTRSGGATRIVLIIKTFLSSEEINIEHWEDVPGTRASRPSTPLYHPRIVHRLTMKKDVTYTGTSLALPFRKLYDILPAEVGQNDNLEFSAQDLNMFYHRYWKIL